MKRVCEVALVSLFVLASSGRMRSQTSGAISVGSDLNASSAHDDVSTMPPLPRGKSTILGGAIRDVDPVLDRFTLRIVGEKPIRILFDERTQVFLDGKKIPLRELRPSSHASVETTLDGTSVFAMSVHILSQLQPGAYRGEVVSYSPSTGDLELVSGQGGEPSDLRFRTTRHLLVQGREALLLRNRVSPTCKREPSCPSTSSLTAKAAARSRRSRFWRPRARNSCLAEI